MTNPKHTDTSRSGDLVERLRQVSSVLFDDYGDGTHAVEDYALPGKAADLIETQAREIERLREACDKADSLADHWFVEYETLRDGLIDILARAALAGDSHDQ